MTGCSSTASRQVASSDGAQHKIFAGLADFVDYLDVIRNTIKLHDKMMVARNIKHWNGPHGVDLSNTIERSYQSCINMYNKPGKEEKKSKSLIDFPLSY